MTRSRPSSHIPNHRSRRPPLVVTIVAVFAIVAAACGSDAAVVSDTDRPTVPVVDVDEAPTPTTDADEVGVETAEPDDAESDPAAAPTEDPTAEPEPDVEPTPEPPPVSVPNLTQAPRNLEVVLEPVFTMQRPVVMAIRPATDSNDVQMYVGSQRGQIMLGDPATGELSEPVFDVGERSADGGERGLLGIAISPDGAYMYIDYTDGDGATIIAELELNPDGTIVDGSEREVLKVDQPAKNHNAGDIVFGPDGFLYITLGDGGGGGDPFATGQDPESLLGSILRIAPRLAEPYAVPSDNPFVDGFGRPEIWLYGVRNPWRISFDSATDDLWIADVGQGKIEEIDVAYAVDGGGRGANLGWSRVEGTNPFNANTPPEQDYLAPIYQYTHDEGCSITGGYVYRGSAIPDLQGVYVFGDYCAGTIWGLITNPDDGFIDRIDLGQISSNSLASFGQGPDGELYVLSHGDKTVFRIEPAS